MSWNRALGVFLVCLILSAIPIYAQFTQSSIVGMVTDPTGAPVAGAEVIVRNEGTNASRTISTEDGGEYRVSGLEAGFYSVTVSLKGFKTFEQKRVDVVSGQ